MSDTQALTSPVSSRTARAFVCDIQQVDEAYRRILKSDVNYRFVIDMTSLKQSGNAT